MGVARLKSPLDFYRAVSGRAGRGPFKARMPCEIDDAEAAKIKNCRTKASLTCRFGGSLGTEITLDAAGSTVANRKARGRVDHGSIFQERDRGPIKFDAEDYDMSSADMRVRFDVY